MYSRGIRRSIFLCLMMIILGILLSPIRFVGAKQVSRQSARSMGSFNEEEEPQGSFAKFQSSLEQAHNAYNSLRNTFQKEIAPSLKEWYIENPIRYQKVDVRQGPGLVEPEKQFLKEREQDRAWKVDASLDSFLATPNLQLEKQLRVAFCGTGGGYRAMVLTGGYLAALEKTKLIDAISYISSLSGSTWFLAPWLTSGLTVQKYQEKLAQKIKDGSFSLSESTIKNKDVNFADFLKKVIWPKILFDQPLGWIDWYGALLSYVLYYEKGTERYQQHLSEQANALAKGARPFPIYTSVSIHKDDEGNALYNWYEFNPYEVRNLSLDLSIPAYEFGSRFSGRKVAEVAPEQSLGFLLGIFGSALAINVKDLIRILLMRTEEEKVKMSLLSTVQYTLMKAVANKLQDEASQFLLYSRFMAAQVNNPFFGVTGTVPAWLKNKELLTFVDGGIEYNIPIRPLMRPERKIDLIIIGDSSGDAATGKEVEKMINDLRKLGYDYRRVDDRKNKTLHFYKVVGQDAPRIVYVNFVKDDWVMSYAQQDPELKAIVQKYNLDGFDGQKCAAGTEDEASKNFCSTFNFNYTIPQFWQLSGIAELNMTANRHAIAGFILQEFGKKPTQEEGGFGD